MMCCFVEGIGFGFVYQGFYGGVLFKQGMELVVLQCGNLEMLNIVLQDVFKQVLVWLVLILGYLFCDVDYLMWMFVLDVGIEMKMLVEDQLGIKILGLIFYGICQLGLNIIKKIVMFVDLVGVKLWMFGGEVWQFLGIVLGVNLMLMVYVEVYIGLQIGVIDGQDNLLLNVDNMKFYEVMKQIVLSVYLVVFDLLMVLGKLWNDMIEDQCVVMQKVVDDVIVFFIVEYNMCEVELVKKFVDMGFEVYVFDVDVFCSYVQKVYLDFSLV